MSNIGTKELRDLLPTDLTSTQVALAEHLARTVCVAHIGKRPALNANTTRNLSLDCRICFEPLADELTLRHKYNISDDDPNQVSHPPRGHTFHLLCLVEWASANLHTRDSITCPSDRQILITREDATRLRVQLNLPPPRGRPDWPQDSQDVLPFWRNADPSDPDRPPATFRLATMLLDDILELAGHGFEVGFIDWEVIGFFHLSEQDRKLHHKYSTYMIPISDGTLPDITVSPDKTPAWQRAFPTCVYVQMARQYVDNHTNVEQGDYIFVPIMLSVGDDFRRRLLAITGPVPYIRFRNGRIDADLNDLDQEQRLLQHRHAQAAVELHQRLEAADHARAHAQSQPGQAYLHPVLDVPVLLRHQTSPSSDPSLDPSSPRETADSSATSSDSSNPHPLRCIMQ